MDNDIRAKDLIPVMVSRLSKLLPYETGNTVENTEQEKIFVSTRKTLLKLAKSSLISEILYSFDVLLGQISKRDRNVPLTKRNIYSLRSVIVVTKLLSECTEEHWDFCEPKPVRKGRVPVTYGESGYIKPFLKYHTVTPQKPSNAVTQSLMKQLLNIRSESAVVDAIVVLSNGNVQAKDNIAVHQFKSLIDEIDEYCTNVCRYLSASNWSVSSKTVRSILDFIKTRPIEESEIIPNIDILSVLYLDQTAIAEIFKDVRQCCTALRNPLQQSLLLHFFSISLSYWIFARPKEVYEAGLEESQLQLAACDLFDYIYSTTENVKYTDGSVRFLSVLLCFFPDIFKTFQTPGARRLNKDSKKLKFMNYINSILSAKQILDGPYDSLSIIVSVGQVLKDFDAESPILQYTINCHDSLVKNFYATYGNEISVSLIHIYCEYFIAYSLIDINYVIKELDTQLNRPDLEPTLICYMTTALRALGAVNSNFSVYQSLINRFTGSMRNIITRQSRLLLKARASNSSAGSSRKSSSTSNSEVVSVPILSNIFQCYIPNPFSYFTGFKEGDLTPMMGSLMEPIIPCLIDFDHELSTSATRFLLSFLDEQMLKTLDKRVDPQGNHPAVAMYLAGCYTLNALAEKIIEIDMCDSRMERFLRLIRNVLKGKAMLAKMFDLKEACGGVVNKFEPENLRMDTYTKVETALLISLCSPDVEIYKLTASAITAALDDSLELGNLTDNVLSSPFLYNRSQYEEFNLNSYVITGNVALQKRIRKLVGRFTIASDGIMNAWEIIHNRLFEDAGSDKFLSTFVSEKRNYSGMLASLSGCILATDLETNVRASHIAPIIEESVREIVSCLESPNYLVCDACREVLSREFSRYANHWIFDSLDNLIKKVIATREKERILKLSDTYIALIKGSISKSIEDRSTLGLEVANGLIRIMDCIDQMGDGLEILKMRIKCTQLVGDLKSNDQILYGRFSGKMYDQWACQILKWFEKSAFKDNESNNSSLNLPDNAQSQRELDHVNSDLVFESSKTLACITKGMVINVPNSSSEEDYLLAKSTKCGGIFSIGVRALEKYSCLDATLNRNSSKSVIGSTNSSNPSEVSLNSISLRSQNISKYVITALSNVLKVNSDVGLKFAVPLGYHKSNKVRGAFVHVLADILQEGMNGGIDEDQDEKLNSLLKYIRSNLSIAVLLCDSCPAGEVDNLASSLLNLYATNGTGLSLLKAAVTREIQKTTKVVELLRRNSVASRMLSLYSKEFGADFLSDTLAPVFQLFLDDPSKHVFELNIDKIGLDTANENIERFMKCLLTFSRIFINSLNKMPSEFREICYTIRTATIQNFPEAAATSVGSFLFLRFFCPAIVAPEANNVINGQLGRDARRSFLLVAKVIQNMANGSLFSLKMPLLYEKMTDLKEVNDRITKFLKDAAVLPKERHFTNDDIFDVGSLMEEGDDDLDEEDDSPVDITKEETLFIHEFLFNHLDAISKNARSSILDDGQLEGRPKRNDMESLYPTSGSIMSNSDIDMIAIARLDELVEAAGQPRQNIGYAVPQQITSDNTKHGKLLYKFMLKNSAKDFGPILEKRMIKEGVSEKGLPFIILSMGLLDKSTVTDPDMVTYKLFQVLSNIWNEKYSMFVDATGFDEGNYIDPSILNNLGALTPKFASENCVEIYYVNCSTCFLPYLKQITTTFGQGRVFNPYYVPYHFICTFNDDLPISPYGMSKKTRSVINDPKTKYSNVFQYDKQIRDAFEVEIKVGEEFVQICKVDTVGVEVGGRKVYLRLVDVYHARDLKGVTMFSNTQGTDKFAINLEDRPSQTFSSPQRGEIIRDITTMIARFSEHSSSASFADQTVHSIKDVISIVLTIGLIGLTSDDSHVRNGSYKIISILTKMFGVEVEIGLPRDGIYYPKFDTKLLILFAHTVARQFPDWAYIFITTFIEGLNSSDPKTRDIGVYILSPCIKNTYKYVYTDEDDSRKGVRRAKNMIKALLKITKKSDDLTSSFHINIWKTLFEEKELLPLLIDVIIDAAIDSQTVGEDCEGILSLISINPTIEACQLVVNKIINLTSISLESCNEAEEFVYSSISYNEVTVLIKACISLFFDSSELCLKFLPDLSFIVSCFLNMGPQEMKTAVHSLTINTIHSFTKLNKLSIQDRNRLNLILEKFTGKRARLLFGLDTDEDGNGLHDSRLIAKITEMAESIINVFSIIGNNNSNINPDKLRSDWKDLMIDASFKKGSIVRARAITVLGILIEEEDASDSLNKIYKLLITATQIAKLNDARALDLNNCIVFCIANIVSKLPPTSHYIPLLFWTSLACSQFPTIGFFTACTTLAINCLKRLDKIDFFDGNLIGVLSRARNILGSFIDEYDAQVNIKYTPEMFDNYVVAVLSRGVYTPATRYHTLNILKEFLDIRIKSDRIYIAKHGAHSLTSKARLYPMAYASFLIGFSRSTRECRKFLSCLGINSLEMVDVGSNIHIPKILIQYFQSETDQSKITTYLLAYILREPKIDDYIFHKGVRVNIPEGDSEYSEQARFMSYSLYEPRIRYICENSVNPEIMQSCQELIGSIMMAPTYDPSKRGEYIQEFLRIPKKYNLDIPLFKELTQAPTTPLGKMVSLLGDMLAMTYDVVNKK